MNDFKKGNWHITDLGEPLDLDKVQDMIDDKMAKNVADEIRKELGQNGLKPHKPLLAPTAVLPMKGSKDP
jgi:hypothetical protein